MHVSLLFLFYSIYFNLHLGLSRRLWPSGKSTQITELLTDYPYFYSNPLLPHDANLGIKIFSIQLCSRYDFHDLISITVAQ